MTWPQRALQIWTVLIAHAHRRQTIRYDDPARTIGFDGPGHRLADPLGYIMRYCEQYNLPPLTVLVVGKNGKPSEGLATSQDFDYDRERVFSTEWYKQVPLRIEDLPPP
jgi:hypothetical protein